MLYANRLLHLRSNPHDLVRGLGNSLISTAMGTTVREQEIDDDTQNWEDEDTDGPEDFVEDWSTGLEHLNCEHVSAQDSLCMSKTSRSRS